MNGDPDKYRSLAERCQKMADAATRESDKREWLAMAHAWHALAEQTASRRNQEL